MNTCTSLRVDPIDHFAHWVEHRSHDNREKLSHASTVPYRYVWASWCRWVISPSPSRKHPPASWMEASPEDVAMFLNDGITPAASARKGKTAPISDITRRGYWRMLNSLYQHAVNRGLVHRNPAALDPTERPPLEKSEGQVFHRLHWEAIKTSIPRGDTRWEVRDRAILWVLMDSAITSSEICTLQRHQVGAHLARVSLSLDGKRAAQERSLQLGTAASVELRRWLEIRRTLPSPSGAHEDTVFVTKQGRALTSRTVMHLVSTTVQRAFADHGMPLPNHLGPQVLRNTRIVMWLQEGVELEEVVYRAGFKDFRSLRGLRAHIDPSIFPKVAHALNSPTDHAIEHA